MARRPLDRTGVGAVRRARRASSFFGLRLHAHRGRHVQLDRCGLWGCRRAAPGSRCRGRCGRDSGDRSRAALFTSGFRGCAIRRDAAHRCPTNQLRRCDRAGARGSLAARDLQLGSGRRGRARRANAAAKPRRQRGGISCFVGEGGGRSASRMGSRCRRRRRLPAWRHTGQRGARQRICFVAPMSGHVLAAVRTDAGAAAGVGRSPRGGPDVIAAAPVPDGVLR